VDADIIRTWRTTACDMYVDQAKMLGISYCHQMTGKKSLEGDQVLYSMLNVAE
jgi:hypothetical protein